VRAKENDKQQLDVPKASWADFISWIKRWKNGKILLGTAGSWFLLDVAFYGKPYMEHEVSSASLLTGLGLGLNNSIILSQIGYTHGEDVYKIFYNQAVGNLIISCAGAIPGYWFTVATVDTVGRKPIQIMGFIILTVIFIVIGFAYNSLSGNALLALYVLAQFFFNFGPNTTTFIVPGEVFPTRYRSSAHGISAASGKIGAIIAQVLIGPLRTKGAAPGSSDSPWLNHVMQIYSAFMFAGIFTSFLIPETKRKTLEQLAGEVEGTPEYDPAHFRSREIQKVTSAAQEGDKMA
jgi:PHS family inorganic phosphate transporter-like MFS transporter